MSVQSRWKTRKVFQSLLVTIGVAFSVVGSAVCARAQVSNLGAAYGLNEGTGTSVADASGNGNTGTVTGASWGTGQFGKALVFSGNASVMIANSPSLDIGGTALTVELWVNISAAASGSDYTILAKPWMAGSMPAPYYQYAVEVDANGTKAVQFFFGNTSGQLRGPFSVTPALGSWAHIAFTYDGAQVKGYLNGAVVVQTAETASIQARGAPLRLGVDGAGGQGYKGSLDEVRIYSRALSQSEIQADMNTPIGGGGGGDTTAPTVSITSPTANPTYSTSSSPLNLGGTGGDNVGVTQVTWVNDRGGSGTASGTTSWTVTGIALQAGTNVVTVTARDAANNTATDTLTVTYTPPSGNLGAAYGLNEGTGTSVADASGNGNTGTVTGASWGTGQFGKALVFSGNASVMIANSPSLDIGGTALTVELWVNISAAASGSDYTILAKPWMAGSMPAPYYQYAVEVDANGTKAVQFFFGNTSGQLRGPFSVTPALGSWAHIAFTYDGAQVKGYLNGAVVVQTAETASIQARGAPLRLGVDGAGGQGYKGSLDEVRIYSRALSQSEIQADMNTPIGGGGGGDTTAPTVSITSPTANPTYSTSSSPLNLGGTGGDNVGVTQVTWVNDRGGSGTASGTTSWTVTGIALQAGTNVVTVTARDAANNTATDTLTVTYTPPLTNGLVAAYNFDEGSGTTVTDASGNNNTGTVAGASWGAGQFGSALSFDGNDSVTVSNSTSLNIGGTALTVELWVNVSAAASGSDYTILAKPWVAGSMPSPYYQYAVEVDANGTKAVQFLFGNTSGQLRGPFKVKPSFGTWTHIAFTYDGVKVTGYVNGAVKLQQAETSSIQTRGTPLQLGVDGAGGQGYKGSLDEVRIYNRALTQAEIQADMRIVNPTGPQIGQWDGPFSWPIIAVHAALLPNGKVLAWDNDSAGQGVQVWNPVTNTFTPVSYNVDNLFCAGLALLRDGKVLVAGGHVANYVGITGATLFNPVTQQWTATAPMSYARWYPTVTTLPDGRALVTSGSIECHTCTANTPEIYNPTTGAWTQLTNATLAISLYPHQFVLPDGRVLVTGSYESSQIPVVARALNINTQTWTTIDPVAVNGGSAAMYLPGKVVTSGLGTTGGADVDNTPSTATTYVLDITEPSPAWRQTASMAFARDFHTLTMLPDGNVLVTGGGTTIGASDPATAVLDAELWSPVSETWTTMDRMQVPRRYHSIALLLPDGRVLVAGGGRNYPVGSPPTFYDHFDAEIFSPPYLFKGVRPIITSTPATLQYDTNFSVVTPDAARIASVSLVRLGAVTHAINMNQRFLNLMFQQVSGGLTVQAPVNANLAPPGDYMLFILDTNGVPSVASMVRFP